MTSRFASNLTAILAGSFLVAAALGFAPAVLGWIALAVGSCLAATVLVAFAMRGRGIVQRLLDVAILVLCAWTIVASRAFAGQALHWLTFASGVLLTTLAVVALVVHEALLELAIRQTLTLQDGDHAVRVRKRPPIDLLR
jgi:hypothetical protein